MPALTPEQEALKQAALATDGAKWETEGFEQTFGNGTFYGGLIMHENGHTIIAQQVLSPHAEFIAAANPAAILALLAQLEAVQAVPDILFDGYAVYEEITRIVGKGHCISPEAVAATLDAAVRMIRAAATAPGERQ